MRADLFLSGETDFFGGQFNLSIAAKELDVHMISLSAAMFPRPHKPYLLLGPTAL